MADVVVVDGKRGGRASARGEVVEITPLGAGSEVGRSCVVCEYKGKKVMFDCGIHPGMSGDASLPYFDEVDLGTIDVILVTHFHLDHCAALPYVVKNPAFKGRIFMTHPTKPIYSMLLSDFVKLNKGQGDGAIFDQKDLTASLDRIELIDYHQEVDVDGIKITPFAAGHVLGAAMFQIDVAGLRVLYTGDYSRKADRHLPAAVTPPQPPHVLIVESTYGVSTHSPREEREKRFTDKVAAIVKRGGRCLLPVVALGRAQELLLILDDFWAKHPELKNVPIYQASALARRSLTIYQTYINMLNEDMRTAFEVSNPFVLKHVSHLGSSGALDDIGPCVVLATPSMLQTGLSRDLFEAWCENPLNGVIIADFAVQGTLAREILGNPKDITTRTGHKVPLKMSVDAISFSAHADYDQTQGFVDLLAPENVVLVHGEATEMGRLKRALEAKAASQEREMTIHNPKNCETVTIAHRSDKLARVVGALADVPAVPGTRVEGLLVRENFNDTLIAEEDLPTYTKLRTNVVHQRQLVPMTRPLTDLRFELERLFEGIHGVSTVRDADGKASPREAISVDGHLTITCGEPADGAAQHVVLEWDSNPVSDLIADSVVGVVLQLEEEPAGLSEAEAALRSATDADEADAARLRVVQALLASQFGDVEADAEAGQLRFSVNGEDVSLDVASGRVACEQDALRARVEVVAARIAAAVAPLAP